jgi:hypothetical protein
MIVGQTSFVKATKDFFEDGGVGRKVEIAEFKGLTTQDKVELRDLLIGQGYDVQEFPVPGMPSE